MHSPVSGAGRLLLLLLSVSSERKIRASVGLVPVPGSEPCARSRLPDSFTFWLHLWLWRCPEPPETSGCRGPAVCLPAILVCPHSLFLQVSTECGSVRVVSSPITATTAAPSSQVLCWAFPSALCFSLPHASSVFLFFGQMSSLCHQHQPVRTVFPLFPPVANRRVLTRQG